MAMTRKFLLLLLFLGGNYIWLVCLRVVMRRGVRWCVVRVASNWWFDDEIFSVWGSDWLTGTLVCVEMMRLFRGNWTGVVIKRRWELTWCCLSLNFSRRFNGCLSGVSGPSVHLSICLDLVDWTEGKSSSVGVRFQCRLLASLFFFLLTAWKVVDMWKEWRWWWWFGGR